MSYRVEMVVNGETIRKIRHKGRTYLPVNNGDEFTIRIENSSGRKIIAIVSVDGKSVIDGEPASHDSSGYVIGAYGHGEIDGWRQSNDVVATFRVGDKQESYSAKTGDGTKNTGVIGVVVYAEKVRRSRRPITKSLIDDGGYREPVLRTCCSLDDSCGEFESSFTTSQLAGTEFGQDKVSHVEEVKFEKDLKSKSVITLYYDTVQGLKNRGIEIYDKTDEPNPFPAESKYCRRP